MAEESIKSATYVGPDCGWNVTAGLRALIRPSKTAGFVLAQFDDFHVQRNGVDQSSGWHEYPSDHFEVDKIA